MVYFDVNIFYSILFYCIILSAHKYLHKSFVL